VPSSVLLITVTVMTSLNQKAGSIVIMIKFIDNMSKRRFLMALIVSFQEILMVCFVVVNAIDHMNMGTAFLDITKHANRFEPSMLCSVHEFIVRN